MQLSHAKGYLLFGIVRSRSDGYDQTKARERERESWPAGGEVHGRAMAGGKRCSANSVYGPPLNEARAREARGDDSELVRVP